MIRQIIDGVDKTNVEVISFNDLSDVDTTGVSTGDFIQFDGTDWVDFDLFATANTWTAAQTFDDARITNNQVLRFLKGINDTDLQAQNSITNVVITLPAATTTLPGLSLLNTWTATQDFTTRIDIGPYQFTHTAVNGTTGLIITEPTATGTASLTLQTTAPNGAAPNFNLIVKGNITIGGGQSGVDFTLTVDGETNDFLATWKEDEDFLEISDDILMVTTEKIFFRDSALSINSSTDGQLDLDADVAISLNVDEVFIGNKITHSGDADNFWALTTDKQSWTVGGVEFMQYTQHEGGIPDTFTLSMGAGSFISMTDVSIGAGLIVINEGSLNIDFRIESANLTHMLFVNSTQDRITFGSVTQLAFVGIDGQSDRIQFLVQAFSTQTSDIFVVEQSDGTDIFVVDNTNVTVTNDMTVSGEMKGTRMLLQCGERGNVVAPFSSNPLDTAGLVGVTSTEGWRMLRAGSITGLSINFNAIAHTTDGPANAEIRVNNSIVFTVTHTVTGTGIQGVNGTQARGTDTFVAGDILRMTVTNNNTGVYTIDDIVGLCEIVYDT